MSFIYLNINIFVKFGISKKLTKLCEIVIIQNSFEVKYEQARI
jgi:hypothetical protein